LLVGPGVLGAIATAVGGGDAPLAGGPWPAEWLGTWSALPGLLDRQMVLRIQGIALDVLITSALATLSIQAIADNVVPFLLLAVTGVVWRVVVFALLAPRMIPENWFERGIGDVGQSLGVTATGLVLIRVADPDAKTPAMEAFGHEQPGFEPFFGSGLVTAASVPLVAQVGPVPLLVVMTLIPAGAVASGVWWFGRPTAGARSRSTGRRE
jgi:ESS family glutamate:Na+ symporter